MIRYVHDTSRWLRPCDQHAHLSLLRLYSPKKVANKLRADHFTALHRHQDLSKAALGVGGKPRHAIDAVIAHLLLVRLGIDERDGPALEIER